MRASLIAILLFSSAQAFAFTQLTCKVSETVYPPLQARTNEFTVTAPLNSPGTDARIDLDSTNFNLHYGFETFLSQLTSPGQQVILIGLRNDKANFGVGADGHGFAAMDYDADNGYLNIQCSVQ
jgi:hypothetical protein